MEEADAFSGVSRLLGMSDWYEIGGGPGLNSFKVGVLAFTEGNESGNVPVPEKVESEKRNQNQSGMMMIMMTVIK